MELKFENTLKIEQKILDNFNRNILSNAILFYGSSGVGKSTLVEHLCKKILNRESLVSPDLLVVNDASKSIGIEDVRNAIEFSNMSSVNENKILVLDGIDNMSIAAINATLKLLEEAPIGLYIFLITTNLYMLPQTLRSRCMQFYVEKPSNEDFVNYINVKLSSHEISRNCIDYLYNVCEGNLTLVYRFLSKVSSEMVSILSQDTIDSANLIEILEKTSDDNFEVGIKIILFEILRTVINTEYYMRDKLIKKFEFIRSEYNKISQYSLSKANVVFTIKDALSGLL
jgi:DNA polymerase III gamma/tau subunit